MTPEQAELLLSMIEEMLLVLGNIQGYLLFFVVVILFFFAYKFLRIFF